MPANDELVTILGVQIAKDAMAKIQSFKAGLDTVADKLKSLSLVATGFAAAAGFLVKGAMDDVAALQTLSDKSGVSTKALQEWGYAAKQAGVSANAVQGDLAKLQKQMMWSGRDGEQQLERYADRLAGMSDQKAMAYGKAFGLSDDTIVLLRQGSDGIRKLKQEANDLGAVIPEDMIKRSEQFRMSVGKLTTAFNAMRTHLAIAMMPALQNVTEVFTKFLVQNREWISGKTAAFMQALVNAWAKLWEIIKKVYDWFKPLVDKFKELTGGMEDVELMTHILQGAFAALLVIFAPIIAKLALLGAAFAAASLIVEDFMYWLNGDESLIGYGLIKFAEKFPGIVKLFETLKDVAKELFTGIVEWAAPIGGTLVDTLVEAWTHLGEVIDDLAGKFSAWINGFTERYPAVVAGFKAIADFLQGTLIKAFEILTAVVKGFWDILGKVIDGAGWLVGKGMDLLNSGLASIGFGGDDKKQPQAVPAMMPQLPQAVPVGPAGRAGTTINDNRTINQQIATSDPQQAADAMLAGVNSGTQMNTPGLYGGGATR